MKQFTVILLSIFSLSLNAQPEPSRFDKFIIKPNFSISKSVDIQDISIRLNRSSKQMTQGVIMIGIATIVTAISINLDADSKAIYAGSVATAGLGTLFYIIGSAGHRRATDELTSHLIKI